MSHDHDGIAREAHRDAATAAGLAPTPSDSLGEGWRRLDPQSIQVGRIAGAIFAVCTSGSVLLGALLTILLGSPGRVGGLLLLGGWFGSSGLLAWIVLAWPVLRYRYSAYHVSPQGILIRRGVLWRTVSYVPRSRVQHTDVSQGPLQRAYGLATLVIYTAGTHNAEVSLGGIARDTALAIRDRLIPGGADDAV